MAAARIFVPNGIESKLIPLSGLWLEGDHFVTSLHFTDKFLTPEKRDRHLVSLKDPNHPKATINSFAHASKPTELSRLAWLKAYDETAGIAIFQASQQDSDKQKNHGTLSMQDLIALPSLVHTQPVWAVAYSSKNGPLDKSPLEPWDQVSAEEKKARAEPTFTKFDLLCEWSLAALMTKEREHWSAVMQPNTYKVPKYMDVFKRIVVLNYVV